MDPSRLRIKRQRQGAVGKRKVKTGCDTCKIRRKKCDERKPSCSQCSSTGRVCDYVKSAGDRQFYQIPANVLVEAQLAHPPRRSLSVLTSSIEEEFRRILRKDFQVHFPVELLESVVFRVAHTEESVRNCIVAILCLRNASNGLQGSIPGVDPVQHYNTAMQKLNENIDGSQRNHAIVIINCILFIYFELLRRSDEKTMVHFSHLFLLIESFDRQYRDSGLSICENSFHADIHSLFIAISQLDVRRSLQIDLKIFPICRRPCSPQGLVSIDDARRTLTVIKERVAILRRCDQAHAATTYIEIDIYNTVHLLDTWHDQFTALKLAIDSKNINITTMHDLLFIEYLTIQIQLSTLHLHEIAYDLHIAQFEQIVNISEKILASDQAGKHMSTTCTFFDIGMAQPLAFVAQKCRVPLVRRRAIGLFEKIRAGRVPDVNVLARALKWVVEKEGEFLERDGIVIEEMRLRSFEVHWRSSVMGKYKVSGERLKRNCSIELVSGII